jgi:hypothetical protein
MIWYQQMRGFFANEQRYIAENFPDLHYHIEEGFVIIKGEINFTTSYAEKEISDSYKICIEFPHNYPEETPVALELQGKIPSEFHTFSNKILCLGTPMEIRSIFNKERTINNFLENLLLPYLFQYSYKSKYGELPIGERSHGMPGIYEFYKEKIGIYNETSIIRFLSDLRDKKLKGHHLCPCGSNVLFRKCHWTLAENLLKLPTSMIEKEILFFMNIHRIEQENHSSYKNIVYSK